MVSTPELPEVPPVESAALDIIRDILDEHELLQCTRDWSAWGCSTMTEHDFVSYDWEIPHEILSALGSAGLLKESVPDAIDPMVSN